VVDGVLAAVRGLDRPRIVDLCTGSGAIALAVATEVAGSEVHAVELDPAAHAWAVRNCAGSTVDLRLGDMVTAFPELDGTVDVVVSNPPYIPQDAVIRDPEVAAHDPAVALWSGADGLDAMRVVEQVAARLLRPGGTVVAEHADLQGAAAPAVFDSAGRWRDVADHRDLAGRDRYVTAVRRGATMAEAERVGG
jgi:release factor glutamine methyltransferase